MIIFAVSRGLRKEEPSFDLAEVVRGDVVQELWETGKVQRGEEINLSFKTAGEIEEIYVQRNQTVEKGDPLAKLNTRDLNIQLEEAKLDLAAARLNLENLLAGASPEEVQIAKTQLEGSRILLQSAQESLEDSYDEAVTVLNDSWPQLDEALEFVRDLIEEYVVIYDNDARTIAESRDAISRAKDEAKDYWDVARSSGAEYQDIEAALSVMRSSLGQAFDNVENVREVIEDSFVYRDSLSETDEALFDTIKESINTSLASTINAQQSIASAKSGLETARANFQEARDYLALTEAEASQTDIDLYENSIKQAESKVETYENQLEDAVLRSPLKGQIADIGKEGGERVTALESIFSLLPVTPFEIEADIYEEDIVQVALGDPAEITLPAFPEEIFQGKVVFIDETEKIIDGVVYYEIRIAFGETPPAGLKNSMTADIVIETGKSENVLVVPEGAISRKGNKAAAEVLVDSLIEEREVEIGLRGDRTVEVISGLAEGEKVIVR